MSDVEARRAARKAQLKADEEAQRLTDLEAVDALECEHGDSNIATLRVPFTPGLPVLLAVRCPNPVEVKRYRSEVKAKKDGTPGDNLKAAQDLCAVCLVYPSKEVFAESLKARPGIDAQLGLLAAGLGAGAANAEGKDS